MRKDLYSNFAAVQALPSASTSAAGDGTVIDLKGFQSALFLVNTGAITSAGDFSFKLQESDQSGAGFADVAAADVIGAAPTTLAASSAYKLGYRGKKRYIRLSVTKAGGTSIQMGAVAILGHPHIAPVA
ncbi:hypothetical protein ASD74_06335 [Rhizobium sp. Root564]|nr:hypothetical protein ASD74_06335 [Rhizobium sp. Root564]